jgi:hypothetical protein
LRRTAGGFPTAQNYGRDTKYGHGTRPTQAAIAQTLRNLPPVIKAGGK